MTILAAAKTAWGWKICNLSIMLLPQKQVSTPKIDRLKFKVFRTPASGGDNDALLISNSIVINETTVINNLEFSKGVLRTKFKIQYPLALITIPRNVSPILLSLFRTWLNSILSPTGRKTILKTKSDPPFMVSVIAPKRRSNNS